LEDNEGLKSNLICQDKSSFEKALLKGVRNIFLLWIISKKKIHGYGIISKLYESLSSISNKKTIHASTVYPLLHSLEEDGLIKSSTELNGKNEVKVYEITEDGIMVLNSLKDCIKTRPHNDYVISFMDDMLFNDKTFTLKEGDVR
jgi:DNA-binding PadR family transcriptional regulator